MGSAAETEMDAVEDVSTTCRTLREVRGDTRCLRALTGDEAHETRITRKENVTETKGRCEVNESISTPHQMVLCDPVQHLEGMNRWLK